MKTLIATELKTSQTRPPAASFRRVAAFLAILLASYALLEIAIFRSGLYARILDPDHSATGYLERAVYLETHRPRSGKKEILVVGNSRIAEGFSSKLANQQTAKGGFWFVNFGVSGTGNRVWYYLVRDVDPHRDRYAAIVIPVDDYNDPDDYEDVADRVSEMPLLVNRLRLTDIVPYTMSFTTWKSRLEVFRGLMIQGATYQRDFQQFLEHPTRRLQRVAEVRAHDAEISYNYGGIHKSLSGLQVDRQHEQITYPPNMPEAERRDLPGTFFSKPPQKGMNRAFEMRWLGALVDLYRGSKTKIIVIQMPRSPAPRPIPLVHLTWTFVGDVRKRPGVTVVDPHTFEDLEKPELFADTAHLNAAGRTIFSPRLAALVEPLL